jgi:hypothetical protein
VACAHSPLPMLDGESVPERLRGIEVGSGCASDYDAWLGGEQP